MAGYIMVCIPPLALTWPITHPRILSYGMAEEVPSERKPYPISILS